MFGLSKERPILDHHAKAHIHEIRQISGEIQWILYGFHEIRQISYGFHMDFTREIHRISGVKSAGFRKTNCQEWSALCFSSCCCIYAGHDSLHNVFQCQLTLSWNK